MVDRKHISQLPLIDVTDVGGDAVLEIEAQGGSHKIKLSQIGGFVAPGGIPGLDTFEEEVAAIKENVAALQQGYNETVSAAEAAQTAIQARLDAVTQKGLATEMAQHAVAAADAAAVAVAISEASSLAAAAAKTASELARDEAQTASVTATGAASASAGDAAVATTKADEASSSASAASASAVLAETHADDSAAAATAAATASTAAASFSSDAEQSATAAQQSEVNAALSADGAGDSATAASAAATAASTRRDEAMTFATAASGSATSADTAADDAAASASTATGASSSALIYRDAAGSFAAAAENSRIAADLADAAAASSASIASAQQVIATSAAASAQASQVLAASVGFNSINRNPAFSAWTGTYPDNYVLWSAVGGSIAKVSSPKGGYGIRFVVTNPSNGLGLRQSWPESASMDSGQILPGYYVIEAEVRLNSGSLPGSGVYFEGNNSAGAFRQGLNLSFAGDKDSTGSVIGAGVVGRTYRFSKLVQLTDAAIVKGTLYPMACWSGFGTMTAKDITLYRASVRSATQEEIAAGTAITALQSTVTQQSGAIADLQGRTAAYWSVTAVAGGRAKLAIYADANGGGGVDIEGDVHISGNLMLDGSIVAGKFLTNQGYDLRGAVPGTFGSRWGSTSSTSLKINNGTDFATVNSPIVSFGSMSGLTTYHRLRFKGSVSGYVIQPDFSSATEYYFRLMIRINGGAWVSTGLMMGMTNLGNTPQTAFGDLYLQSTWTGSAEFGLQTTVAGKHGAIGTVEMELLEITAWR